jgi:hypothetical protein
MYSELKPERILETITLLEQRITERFPGSSLSGVSGELRRIAEQSDAVTRRLGRPIWPLRIAAGVAIASMVLVACGLTAAAVGVSSRVESIADLLQASEAAVNEVILLSLAIFFLLSLEGRVKRRAALAALHRLRSIAHIVDMHQLTKDPQHLLVPARPTQSSPKRTFTRWELARYLDYCSELLSLTSKLAALHVQYVNDPVVLSAVNDIETLASSMSNKIWQKIMILDVAVHDDSPPEGMTENFPAEAPLDIRH